MILEFLLYYLAIIFLLLIIPLISLIVFLHSHRSITRVKSQIEQVRHVFLVVSVAKLSFLIGEIIAIFIILNGYEVVNLPIVIYFSLTTTALCIANWWAFFKVRELQQNA